MPDKWLDTLGITTLVSDYRQWISRALQDQTLKGRALQGQTLKAECTLKAFISNKE